jgi:hypothetical protein
MVAVKSVLGPSYTVTHLAHAAMVLAMLRSNPLPDDYDPSLPFVTRAIVNARTYLEFNKTEGLTENSKTPVALCVAVGEVVFPSLKSYQVGSQSTLTEVREKLLAACRAAHDSYLDVRRRNTILLESIPVQEFLAGQRSRYNSVSATFLGCFGPNMIDAYYYQRAVKQACYFKKQKLRAEPVNGLLALMPRTNLRILRSCASELLQRWCPGEPILPFIWRAAFYLHR